MKSLILVLTKKTTAMKNQDQIFMLAYQDIIHGKLYEDVQEAPVIEVTSKYAVLNGHGGAYAVPWNTIEILY